MKKSLLLPLLTLLICTYNTQAQNVGIGTATPHASAKLHIVDPNRGLLIPNVALGNISSAAPVAGPAIGLLVYNTNPSVTGGNGTGFYYWSGAQWLKLITATSSDIDFYEVGTTTAPNNIADNMYTQGRVSIGYTTPGVHTLIVANATPAIKLGNSSGFNNVESGRFTFEENVPNYTGALGTLCGFEFIHDGSANVLNLNVGCTGQTTIATFTRNGARMGLKTTAPTADLSVNGTANKTGGGTWAVFSDARLKKDVVDFKEGLDLITKVRTVSFSYNDKMKEVWGENESMDGRVYQGVIAQELQEIAPDMVREVTINAPENSEDADFTDNSREAESYLEVDPNKFTYALINAVQEQQEMIEDQRKEMSELEKENAVQKAELEALKKRMERIEKLLEK